MITQFIFILLNGFFVSTQEIDSLLQKFYTKNIRFGARIVGGRNAKIEEAPFFVTVVINYQADEAIVCGGSYISGLWVLTAAHCIDINFDDPEKLPDPGKHNRVMLMMEFDEVKKPEELKVQFRVAAELIIHPDAYLVENSPDIKHDIALIKLDCPFNITKKAKTAILPEKQLNYDGSLATLVGWGGTDVTTDLEEPTNLQIVKVTVLAKDSCKQYKKYKGAICAGKRGQGSCFGDSGGPLIYEGIIIGITSRGDDEHSPNTCDVDYGVYENVYTHLPWILKHIQNLPDNPSKSKYNRLSRNIIWLSFIIEHLNLLKTYNYV